MPKYSPYNCNHENCEYGMHLRGHGICPVGGTPFEKDCKQFVIYGTEIEKVVTECGI